MAGGYPVLFHIEGKRCVIAGGGAVAERKAAGLLEAGADVLVVAPGLSLRLREWAEQEAIRAEAREIRASDLDGAALAFAATDRPDVNRWFASEARRRGIPANVADDGEAGDFVTPAVVRRGDFVLAVSASGAGPALSARVARELAERYGPEYAELTAILRKVREAVKAGVADPAERRRLLGAASTDEAIRLWLSSPPAIEEPERLLRALRELAESSLP